jgi:hypothetical protein
MIAYGFSQYVVDSAAFTISTNGLLYILAIYVDDSILVGRNGLSLLDFKATFATCFDIEDLSPAS